MRTHKGVVALTATTIAIAALTAIGTGLILSAIIALQGTVSLRETYSSTANTEACVEDAIMRVFYTGVGYAGTYTTTIDGTTCNVSISETTSYNQKTIEINSENETGYHKDITAVIQTDTDPFTLISWTEN